MCIKARKRVIECDTYHNRDVSRDYFIQQNIIVFYISI